MNTAPLTPEDAALAGELALGLLSPEEAAAAQARVAADLAFAEEVAAWQKRLSPLLDVDAAPVPDSVWQRIDAVVTHRPVQDNQPGKLRIWQAISLLSTVAALAMGVMLFTRPVSQPAPSAPAPLVAALGNETGDAALTTSYDVGSGTLTVTPVSLNTGKLYPELWLIPADGTARSLGIVAQDRPMRINVSPRLRGFMTQGVTLAITPEPQGGAPGGKATGPVIASGKTVLI